MDLTNPSLLQRAGAGLPDAWAKVDTLYRPFLQAWFRGRGVPADDANDLTQEVMIVLINHVKTFNHPGHQGAFRNWLRGTCLNRLLGYRRSRRTRGAAVGGSDFNLLVQQLDDSSPDASVDWEAKHDHAILTKLFDDLVDEFEPNTIQAFRRLAFDGIKAPDVARELRMTVGAVYIAKSRVLRRLRAEAEGLVGEDTLV